MWEDSYGQPRVGLTVSYELCSPVYKRIAATLGRLKVADTCIGISDDSVCRASDHGATEGDGVRDDPLASKRRRMRWRAARMCGKRAAPARCGRGIEAVQCAKRIGIRRDPPAADTRVARDPSDPAEPRNRV